MRFPLRLARPTIYPGDIIAGVITAVLLVPQALAYAFLAGMPPEAGLYAAMAPALIYAVFGTSPALSVGPVAVVSLMTASTLAPLAPAASADYAQQALLLALLSGVMLFLLGLFRLGVLINFLSFPVISGFTMGAAMLIILSQLPQILGLNLPTSGDAWSQLVRLAVSLGGSSWLPALYGCVSIGCLLAARGPLRAWLAAAGMPPRLATLACRTMPLLLVLVASACVTFLHHGGTGLRLVGPLAAGLPVPRLPEFSYEHFRALIGPAALIGLVGYLEGISIAQVLGRRHRHEVDANRELLAIGLANILASVTRAMPVAGSLSRSVVNDGAGVQTKWAGVLTALLVAGSSLLLSRLLETLPRAVLAAIIIVAVLRLLELPALRRIWRYNRADGLAWVATTLGVLAAGAELGLIAGLVVSLLLYIWRTANPHIVEVGRVPYSDLFVEADRHHEVELWPQLLLVRIDESLFFGNASAVQNFVIKQVSARPQVTDVILICSAVNAIDSSALQMLEDLTDSLQRGGVTVHLAEVKGPIMDRLIGSRLLSILGRQRMHPSTSAAVLSVAAPPI